MLTALASACYCAIYTYGGGGRVGVLVGCQLAAREVCRLPLIRLLTGRQWSRNQDEISCLTDSSLSHLPDRGVASGDQHKEEDLRSGDSHQSAAAPRLLLQNPNTHN